MRALLPLAIAAAAGCSVATSQSARTAPCDGECTLRVTNATPFELDVQITDPVAAADSRALLSVGETRTVTLASHHPPRIGVVGLRSVTATRGTAVRIRCSTPVRGGDTFRSECRVMGSRRTGSDAAPGDAPRSVQ